jgi:hypothetical protein
MYFSLVPVKDFVSKSVTSSYLEADHILILFTKVILTPGLGSSPGAGAGAGNYRTQSSLGRINK